MKHAKRMTAVLLALLLLAALAVPGMAAPASVTYTPVSFHLNSLGLTETLTAIYEDYKNPAVTYTLTLGNMLVFNSYDYDSYNGTGSQYAPSDATADAATALNGKTLATATFTANEVPYEESNDTIMSKTVSYSPAAGILAAINALSFDRPCIVYWPVTKDFDCDSSDLTNFNHNRATDGTTKTVMILRVDDIGSGELSPTLSFAAPQEINRTTLMALLEKKYEESGKTTTLTFEEWVEDEYGYDDLDDFFEDCTTDYDQFMNCFGPEEGISPAINYANFPYIFTESNQKFQEFQDEYPATNSLKVNKIVTGNQGKKDQYFKFTVVLGGDSDAGLRSVLPEIANQLEYVTANSVHTATPKYGERFVTYNDATPPVITSRYDNEHPTVRIMPQEGDYEEGDLFYFDDLFEGGYYEDPMFSDWIEIDFWLKHGESFEIKNIPANVEFFAAYERPSVEGDMINITGEYPDYYFDGYTVTTLYSRTETGAPGQIPQLDYTYEHDYHGSITKGAVDLTYSGRQYFSPYTSDDKVTFTNSKDTSTPTGLSLQTAAPIAGAVIALGLGAVLLLSRRRRGSAQ